VETRHIRAASPAFDCSIAGNRIIADQIAAIFETDGAPRAWDWLPRAPVNKARFDGFDPGGHTRANPPWQAAGQGRRAKGEERGGDRDERLQRPEHNLADWR